MSENTTLRDIEDILMDLFEAGYVSFEIDDANEVRYYPVGTKKPVD
jgi:hypothetical protein